MAHPLSFMVALRTLLENPLPILAAGAVLATLSGLVFWSRRNLPSLFVFLVVVLLTLLLLITESLMFFDQVEFQWVRRDQRWLLHDFVAFWKGKPLNAVHRLRANRPAPATR